MQLSIYVAESRIHGRGLFAGNRISAGTVIGRLRVRPAGRDGTYVLWLDENRAVEVVCDLKFINHSDRPNACYYDDLSVVALRDIAAGEEITHDYTCSDW
jgi:SET domain-containing protein